MTYKTALRFTADGRCFVLRYEPIVNVMSLNHPELFVIGDDTDDRFIEIVDEQTFAQYEEMIINMNSL